MRFALQNRTVVAIVGLFAIMSVLEALRWTLLQGFELFGVSIGSAIGLALILTVLVTAYRVDVARAQRSQEGRR
jgi:ABC-type polysaccharide/polyol phosphate export permease